MHIAIDYTPAIRQGAGIGRLTRHLVRELVQTEPRHRYTLFVAGPVDRRSAEWSGWPANVRLRPTPVSERLLTILWHRLRLPLPVEWFTGRCDLFHSTDFVLPPVAGARTLLTVHDLTFLRYPDCAHPPLRAYLQNVVPRSLARADCVVADSQSTKKDLVELLGVPGEKIAVVYGGVDSRFAPESSQACKTCELSGPYILSVGTLEPRKNYARLIRAYARLCQETGLPHLLVIAGGKGWLYDDIFAEVRRLGLEQRVRFLGFVDDAALPALYRGAELFVFPSLYEGFGFPPLEAMACGCPVVASNSSSLPEVCGDAAILVPPEDEGALAGAMSTVFRDAVLRQALRARGLAQAAHFTWPAAARRLVEEYEKVAA